MDIFIWLIPSGLILSWWLAYHDSSRELWTFGWGILLGCFYVASGDANPIYWSVGLWSLAATYFAVALFANFHTLRKSLITSKIMGLFRQALPTLSSTEKEALEAGTVWWDSELFSGAPNWQRLLAIPKATLTPAEQEFLDGPVEKLCHLIDDWHITSQRHDLPPNVWSYLKKEGFFGLVIETKYGGKGFSALAHSSIVAKVASRSVTAAVTVMVPNSLGPAELLRHYGTDEQRDYFLPRLADGREVPCFALTGPQAGSDAGSMPDTGVVVRKANFEGKRDVLGIELNWNKRYITLAPVATILGLAFKLYDPDHLIGNQSELGITLALIPTTTKNITIGKRHDPLGIPFLNGPTQGRDVFIPLDWVIGGPQRVGQGWRMLMDCLSEGRAISLPALSSGAAKTCSRVVGNYARVRKQFGLPIGRFEGVAEQMGHMSGQTYLMEAARTFTAGAVDQGEKPSVISALTKYQLTERMRLVVNNAMDIMGGAAISRGPKNMLSRIYQSIPIGITVEGANILTRTLIVFGQGAIRAHPYLLKELHALDEKSPNVALAKFDKAFFGHVGFVVNVLAKTLWQGLTGGRTIAVPGDGFERRYFQQLSRLSAAFAMISDTSLLTLGGSLKRREILSGRMADALSHLYLGSAVMKRYHDQGRKPEDHSLVEWSMAHNLHGAEDSLHKFLANFPIRPIAWFLKVWIFPFGRTMAPPSDRTTLQVANILMEPSAARDRLTNGIYLPVDQGDPMAMLEEACSQSVAMAEVESKVVEFAKANHLKPGDDVVKKAVAARVLTSMEARRLVQVHKLCNKVIQVDDFPPTDFTSGGRKLEDAA
ncbi:MAG: acyl-CoA dehydrogenase [Magnetococcales bacterium]|nr:acyl-CoA dehydrogenase [Magnetococcales bacterium]